MDKPEHGRNMSTEDVVKGILTKAGWTNEHKPFASQPMPFLTMGVDIDPYWAPQFRELQRLLNKTPKETINWVVDNWFRNTIKAHE